VNSNYNPFATSSEDKDVKNKSYASSFNARTSYKNDTHSSWESLYVGLKQDTFEVEKMSFETDGVVSKLFDEEATETKSLFGPKSAGSWETSSIAPGFTPDARSSNFLCMAM
jgi:DNA mismatch repair protein MutL